MRPFWPIVGVVLLATLCVWPPLVAMHTRRGDISYHATLQAFRYLIAYPLTIVLLAVVWAIVFRPQIDRGRVSLAAIFVLITILAVGLCYARFMLSLS
jgi:hypothetical protein